MAVYTIVQQKILSLSPAPNCLSVQEEGQGGPAQILKPILLLAPHVSYLDQDSLDHLPPSAPGSIRNFLPTHRQTHRHVEPLPHGPVMEQVLAQ